MHDLVAGDRAVGLELLFLGVLEQDVDHDAGETGGHADLDAVLVLKLVGHLDHTG